MKTPFTLITLTLCLAFYGCTKEAGATEESTGQAANAASLSSRTLESAYNASRPSM